MSIYDYVKIGLDLLIVPVFAMVWSVQGRLSRLEGEIKSLYQIIRFLGAKK